MSHTLILDYETRSRAPLKNVGAWEYAAHASTEILCAAWIVLPEFQRSDDLITGVWCEKLNYGHKETLLALLRDAKQIVAHNAGFEYAITTNVLGLDIPPEKWICTAARSAAMALPRSLDGVTQALNLPHKKNPKGKLLIQRHCKPRTPTKNKPWEWDDDPVGLQDLLNYCVEDVAAEYEVLRATRKLTNFETKVWCLDQRINTRGVLVDLDLVDRALDLVHKNETEVEAKIQELTDDYVSSPTKREAVLDYLFSLGFTPPNLQKKTVEDILKDPAELPFKVREVLELRQQSSKTSTAKYLAFKARTESDGRLRDLLLYHGASTGRWTGAGVQVQNFPRGVIKDPLYAVKLLKLGDIAAIEQTYGGLMPVLSSVLRCALTADFGCELFCGDFASIEVRVLFWIANHFRGLDLYHQKRDAYREMAAIIYNVPLEQVTKDQREVGKRAILGAGYGMGAKKFRQTCFDFGAEITEDLAKVAIDAYRETHSKVPDLWRNLEKAAIAAVLNPKNVYTINRTKWFVQKNFLFCELPSGRRLSYPFPEVKYEKTPWGETRAKLYIYATNPVTKKWEQTSVYGGLLTENVVQATARDLMAHSMVGLEEAGFQVLFSVHDEAATQARLGTKTLEEFKKVMTALPAWALGCPVEVDAWCGERYRK